MRRVARWRRCCRLLCERLGEPGLAGAEPDYDQVYAGHYQAILGDCMGCHTGRAAAASPAARRCKRRSAPWSRPTSRRTVETGIGRWSEAEFRRAVKQGIAPGGKRLYPAMPYPVYARMSDDDVGRLWAYMQTVEPVRARCRANQLRFPFNIRALMAGWNWLYFKPAVFTADAAKSAACNRGAYIVTGPGHCGACHTAKTLLGADIPAALGGASLQGWFAPDITAGAARRGRLERRGYRRPI